MKRTTSAVLFTGLIALAQSLAAAPFTEEDIDQSFYPYNDWTPTAEGYTPGMVIDQSNVDQFQTNLDEALYKFVKDGWVTIRTAETTDFPLSDDYVNATRKYAAEVSLAENGTLNNFVAGRAYRRDRNWCGTTNTASIPVTVKPFTRSGGRSVT